MEESRKNILSTDLGMTEGFPYPSAEHYADLQKIYGESR